MRIFERFLDWFRPGWRRSVPEERLRAIERLGEEDAATLVDLARRDGDARVRWAAARKIHDPDVLAGMAVEDPDPTVRRAAADRAWRLFVRIATSGTSRSLGALERRIRRGSRRYERRREAFEAMRRRAVARLIDPQLLALVARNADDPMTRREAAAHRGRGHPARDRARRPVADRRSGGGGAARRRGGAEGDREGGRGRGAQRGGARARRTRKCAPCARTARRRERSENLTS